MSKKRSVLLILLSIMIACSMGYLWLKQSQEKPPGAVAPLSPAIQPAEQRIEAPKEQKAGQVKPAPAAIELPEEAKQTYASPVAEPDFNETMKREERKSIQITPGIAFHPGKGINIKKPGSEEVIQIRKDNTYRSDEVKVQWEKKF